MTHILEDRAAGALLGLALGDGYGRPLEFVRGSRVRTQAVDTAKLVWTDDTHMALYLAEAVLAQPAGAALDEDRFGRAVGEQFSLWLDDPLTPSTAPGNTCMAGARSFRQSGDWRQSGVRASDGCGAVMRICPLALVYTGEDLTRAARVSAAVTHAHPDALEAAVAACHMLRLALEEGRLEPSTVERAMRHLLPRSVTQQALRAALTQAMHPGTLEWLDEAAIPAGDGGWRAPSALGLAVAAALAWGRTPDGQITQRTFMAAVEKAARIDGDSDSVACLAGMLLGAAGGTAVLPPAWLGGLFRREAVEGMAQRLVRYSRTSAPERGTLPLVAVADLHGHVDHLNALVAHLDRTLGADGYRLVTLGDYVDNGPDVPALLERLIDLKAERGDRFVPILGNHDLACSRALGFPGYRPDPVWFSRWQRRYWGWRGGRGSTADAYGATSAEALAAKMPAHHQAFLRELPWFYEADGFLFVHAGMERGPLAPQVAALAARTLPEVHEYLPPALREKGLAQVSDPAWDRVVVSGHTRVEGGSHWATATRILLSGEVDWTGNLYAMVLPERRLLAVDPEGRVRG